MLTKNVKSLFTTFAIDRRGNISTVAALSMPVLVGFLGLGAETASWYNGKRALQNAADSAAIAAATNADSSSYADEAKAVAARYGYQDGVDGVTVTAVNNAPCPDGSPKCYAVTISRLQPMILAQVTGYDGEGTVNGNPAKLITAKAVAIQGLAPREYCVLALASSGDPEALRTNGAPKADLTGCSVMSNSNAQCNGHDLKAEYGDAFGTNDGCGKKKTSNVDKLADPYSGLTSNIPAQNCPGYPVAPKKKHDTALPPGNVLGGTETRTLIPMCGDVQLSSDLTIASGSAGSVLLIRNGSLDLNGHTLKTQNGSALTVIFTGDDNSRSHAPIGTGTFDYQAPTTGPWKGVAMYQHPSLTGGVDIKEAGNQPTWSITGLVYLPKASVTFSGAVNKSSYGKSCFGLVVDNVTINGTGSILSHGECDEAGLELPHADVPTRGELVS
ncbi:pilus assembly protein TadG-related protein [Phenylobacterium sp.]|uniref:pilus assembly protein TadG-related protein n=1 Tax=Phenylobacterium sp. TaxID=1871053 RepID=UPI002ED7F1E3